MRKLFSVLLAGVLVAASAISASAASAHGGGVYTLDESDNEYWSADLSMLDKTAPAIWLEDGTPCGYNDPSYTDASGSILIDELEAGWYEVVLCDLGTNAEWFPEEVKGKVALAVRGDSTFTVKSENAKNAGAIACLVGNNCRDEEAIDEDGNVTTGTYSNISMSVDYYTIPMCSLGSDTTVRLVAATADISTADAVDAIRAVFGGNLELGLESKNSAWVFIGNEEEYKANTTRTDANTKTGADAVALVGEAPAVAISAQEYPSMDPIESTGEGYASLEDAVAAIGKTAITGVTYVTGTSGNASEGPENIWDNDTATKFCTTNVPTISIAELDGEYTIDGLIMATANDNSSYNNRSPYEWAVYGSADGAAWTALAYGDDYFFAETDFTYYAAPLTTEGTYKYIMFQSEGGLSGTFQMSELVVCGTKIVTEEPVAEEAPAEEPVVEEAPAEEPVIEEAVVEEPAVEETVVEEPAVEEVAETEEVVEEAAQTFDFGVIAAVAAIVSAAGYAISKKR